MYVSMYLLVYINKPVLPEDSLNHILVKINNLNSKTVYSQQVPPSNWNILCCYQLQACRHYDKPVPMLYTIQRRQSNSG